MLKQLILGTTLVLASFSSTAGAATEIEVDLPAGLETTETAATTVASDQEKAHQAWVERAKNDPERVNRALKKIGKVRSDRKLRCWVWGGSLVIIGGQEGICRSRHSVYAMSSFAFGLTIGLHGDFVRYKFPYDVPNKNIRLSGERSAIKFILGIEGGRYDEQVGGTTTPDIRMFGVGAGFEFTPWEGIISLHFDKIRDR